MDKGGPSSSHPPLPPISEEDLFSCLRLLRSRRVGVATYHRLINEHGSAGEALRALPGIAAAAGVQDYAPCPERNVEDEMRRAERSGARLVAAGTAGYPSALATIEDAPPLIWVRGRKDALARPHIALVGARNASSLGARMTRRLATDLGAAGWSIASGLARGIDTAAHGAALDTGTVAVVAGGADHCYPAENARLMDEIVEKGAVVSEMPMGLHPQARHFPRRNRLISGIARAVVVVEAAAKSGSLITASIALDQGREVFAVPGHPFDARAAGSNMLLRDGATLVRGASDIIEALGEAEELGARDVTRALGEPEERSARGVTRARGEPEERSASGVTAAQGGARAQVGTAQPFAAKEPSPAPRPEAKRSLTDTALLHRQILDRLGPSPMAEDQLIRDCAAAAEEVSALLVDLEIEGQIERQSGGLLALKDA
ncbi:MAG: DNA-processing protein DprA [Pseudomonadota bacterium]